MWAVKTILSISFLLLASSINAIDKEKYDDLPDEIKNLKQKKILNSIVVRYAAKTKELSSTSSTTCGVIVKLKLKRDGAVDTAVVVYCEDPNLGFENLALQTVLESTFEPKLIKRRRIDRSWFYTEVIFARIENYSPPSTDSLSLTVEGYKQNDSNFVPVEVMPELIYKGRPEYPELGRLYGMKAVVTVRVLIDEKGNVLDAIVPGNSNTRDSLEAFGFIEAALTGAKKCRFTPAFQNGEPVKVWVSFPYEFILHR